MDPKVKSLIEDEEMSPSQLLLSGEVSGSGWSRIQEESKRLWVVAGPAMISRISMFGLYVITLAFCGHLGDIELAAMSIVITVLLGFNFSFVLGMASALETLAGQAYGGGHYRMLGVLLQRSWILLLILATALLPTYLFTAPILILLGQPKDIAEMCGFVAVLIIPLHYVFPILSPVQRFLQCQSKNHVYAITAVIACALHGPLCWFLIVKCGFGLVGAAMALNFSWWFPCIGNVVYVTCGGCPLTWPGFSKDAFSVRAMWDFCKLSVASGVMLCIEDWYYKILVVATGHLPNAEREIASLAVCMTINGWEMMIPLSFLGGIGLNALVYTYTYLSYIQGRTIEKSVDRLAQVVRVSNELGSGKGQRARYAAIVAVGTSSCIGIVVWALILVFHNNIALLFTESSIIVDRVSTLSSLLAFTILLNSVQPVLSGVAVGMGWQAYVAYVNVACYYIIGVPLGVLLGWAFHLGVLGIWTGMIGGTFLQTVILSYASCRCDWDTEAVKAIDRCQRWSTVA